MPESKAQQDFYTFMEEYTEFLGRMLGDEQSRLSALQSRDLSRIESSISVSQANTKQLENYELKRVQAQGRAGYGGLSFRELLEAAPPDARRGLSELFSRFERYIGDIRFFNNKCMAVARDGMLEIDPSAVLPAQDPAGQKATSSQNPYQQIQEHEKEQKNSILETKI